MRRRALLFLGLCLGILPGAAGAQSADTTATVDRIVAVVGNRPILRSQIEEQALTALRGQKMPTDPAERSAFFQAVLDGMVEEELVVQAARQDTAITVTDEEVTQSVDELFRNARAKFSNDEAFQADLRATGFQTVEEWRSYYSDRQRREFLVKRFWERQDALGKMKPIPPTDAEIQQYFDQRKAQFGKRPETISFEQIIMAPHAAAPEKAVARALADSILKEIRAGADFAGAARRFSMDPSTRDQGGSLNWIRRGQGWDPVFENVAFSLEVGQVSNPVETAFGYHLIQVERAQGAEVQVRHILIMPTIDSVQADSARVLAEQIYLAAKNGAAFDSLQRLYHDKGEERSAEHFPLDQLTQRAPTYANAVNDIPAGQVAPLFRLEAPDPNRSKYAIVKVTGRTPAGEVRLEDVKEQIRTGLARELAKRRFIATLKQATYVEVRSA